MKNVTATCLDPGPIMQLATGYWGSRCFLAASRIGVFQVLANGPKPAEAVAEQLNLAPRPTQLLLKACVGLELLEEDARGFRNHPRTQRFLVRGPEAFLGDAVCYAADMWDAWSRVETALTSDRPPTKPETYTGGDPEKTRHLVRGMHNRAISIGRALISLVDLSGRARLLDVGGGPGTYSALFAQAYPGLQPTVMDLPGVIGLADEILESMDAGGRVRTLAADYKTTTFPVGNDAILMSGVFHRESAATCRALISRARDALVPGGLLIVSDVFTDRGGTSPAFAALFGVNMMLSTPDGGVHADADVVIWMEQAGFRSVERKSFPPPMPHRIVTGTL